MKKLDLKIFSLYIVVIIYILFSSFLLVNNYQENFTYIINPICWLLIFIIGLYITKEDKSRFKAKMDKGQMVFIIILIYLIIYFFLGLFLGYQKSPYSHSIMGYIKNFLAFFLVIIFREFTRSVFINNCNKNKFLYIITTLLFILVEINFSTLVSSFTSGAEAFKYLCSTLIPLIFKNILLTYLVVMAGCQASLAYLLPISFSNIVLPIFPSLDWFMVGLSETLLVLITFISVNHIHEEKTSRLSRRNLRKKSPYKMIPLIVVVLIFVCFVAGFFKYMPVAIMSNSMYKMIERGDVVIISKLNENEKKSLKVGDIIEYRLDNSIVVHRIIRIEIDKNDNLIFTTKGDNNKLPDNKKVTEEQVVGRVRYKIPKVGYPAVLLNEFFEKTKPDVET